MQDKQKVTLYLSSDLRHQLKIRAAIDRDNMSDLAEKAISFYLSYPDVVESGGVGHTHQVYSCPECTQSLVFKSGELLSLTGNVSLSTARSSASERVIKSEGEMAIL